MDGFVKIGEDWINTSIFSHVTPTEVRVNGVVDKSYTEHQVQRIYKYVNQLLELEKGKSQRAAEMKEKDALWIDDMKKCEDHRNKISLELDEARLDRQEWRKLVTEQRQHWEKLEKVLSRLESNFCIHSPHVPQ